MEVVQQQQLYDPSLSLQVFVCVHIVNSLYRFFLFTDLCVVCACFVVVCMLKR